MSCHLKHEIIHCRRCGIRFECKIGSVTICQCMSVQLNLNETQYLSEKYDACLCAACLVELKKEYELSLEHQL